MVGAVSFGAPCLPLSLTLFLLRRRLLLFLLPLEIHTRRSALTC